MNGRKRAVLIAVLAMAIATGGTAHGEGVMVFFSEQLDPAEPGMCPGWGVVDTLYVGAWNFSEPFDGIEFRVEGLDGPLFLLNDICVADSTYGLATGDGISLFWDGPVYAPGLVPVVIHMLEVFWQCDDCDELDPAGDYKIEVKSHLSATGSSVEATRWPDGATILALGLLNRVCPATIGTESSTWGAIKALYR